MKTRIFHLFTATVLAMIVAPVTVAESPGRKCLSAGNSLQEAMPSCRKAAKQGHAASQMILGMAYFDGLMGVSKDKSEAVRWWRMAAEQGHDRAQNKLALAYSRGEGVEENQKAAVHWWRKAAEMGNPAAQESLGLAYEAGDGVTMNMRESYIWLLIANDIKPSAGEHFDSIDWSDYLSESDMDSAIKEAAKRMDEIKLRYIEYVKKRHKKNYGQ